MKPLTIGSDMSMPPNGWKITVPETGQTIHANYANALMAKVNAHRTANGLAALGRTEFEDAVCRESGHGAPWCIGVRKPKSVTTMDKIRRFLRTMAVLARKRELVDQGEHSRRMEICRTCPLSTIEGLGCHGCISDLREVEKTIGEIPPGNVLACSSCGCVMFYKCWISNSVLDEAEEADKPAYQEGHCWRLGN